MTTFESSSVANGILQLNGDQVYDCIREVEDLFYRLVPLTEDDRDKVAKFLSEYFLKDEPLNVAIGLKPNDESYTVLRSQCLTYISTGLSLAAVSESGEILGLCLNGCLIRNESENNASQDVFFDGNKFGEDKAQRVHYVLDTMKQNSDVFGQFPNVDKLLDIFIVCVNDVYRGKGICKAMIDKTRKLARENDFPLIKVDCTSHFTAKAARRLGFKCIYSVPYESIVDTEGHPVIKPELPHVRAETYVTFV